MDFLRSELGLTSLSLGLATFLFLLVLAIKSRIVKAPETGGEAAPEAPVPLFSILNRGIVVGVIYSFLIGVLLDRIFARAPGGSWFVNGLMVGTLVAFSNTVLKEKWTRDLLRNLLDALVTFAYVCVAITIAFTIAFGFEYLQNGLSNMFTAAQLPLAGGLIVGALVGEPLFRFLANKANIKGRNPFLFINKLTESIANPDTQFVVRVIIQTILALIVIVVGVAAVIVIAAVAIIGLIIYFATREEGTRRTTTVRVYQSLIHLTDPNGKALPGQRVQLAFGAGRTEVEVTDDEGDVLIEHGQTSGLAKVLVNGSIIAEIQAPDKVEIKMN